MSVGTATPARCESAYGLVGKRVSISGSAPTTSRESRAGLFFHHKLSTCHELHTAPKPAVSQPLRLLMHSRTSVCWCLDASCGGEPGRASKITDMCQRCITRQCIQNRVSTDRALCDASEHRALHTDLLSLVSVCQSYRNS